MHAQCARMRGREKIRIKSYTNRKPVVRRSICVGFLNSYSHFTWYREIRAACTGHEFHLIFYISAAHEIKIGIIKLINAACGQRAHIAQQKCSTQLLYTFKRFGFLQATPTASERFKRTRFASKLWLHAHRTFCIHVHCTLCQRYADNRRVDERATSIIINKSEWSMKLLSKHFRLKRQRQLPRHVIAVGALGPNFRESKSDLRTCCPCTEMLSIDLFIW